MSNNGRFSQEFDERILMYPMHICDKLVLKISFRREYNVGIITKCKWNIGVN